MTTFQQAASLASSNIYSVNMRQFTEAGTFKAFEEHLPRLHDMGVEILWFMPIHPIGKLNRKGTLGSYYSIKDFQDVNPEYGDKKDFLELVQKAQAMGMKVILDWVANHAAWDNVWTVNKPHFFVRDEAGNFKAPYDWEDVIQIDHTNEEEQQTMIDAMKYWVEHFNIDGFRADLAHLTPLPFWINARTQLTPVKKDLIWLAETEDIPYHQAFDITFTWKWMHITESYCKGKEPFAKLIETLHHYAVDFPAEAMRMYFTSNHDENSWCGTEYEKYGDFVKCLGVFASTWHGIPLVYTGQELPVKRRLAFFDKDNIEWEDQPELHDFYKTLLHLRKTNHAIAAGLNSPPVYLNGFTPGNVIAFFRSFNNDKIIVLLNMTNEPIDYRFDTLPHQGTYEEVFTKTTVQVNDSFTASLPAAGYLVLKRMH